MGVHLYLSRNEKSWIFVIVGAMVCLCFAFCIDFLKLSKGGPKPKVAIRGLLGC